MYSKSCSFFLEVSCLQVVHLHVERGSFLRRVGLKVQWFLVGLKIQRPLDVFSKSNQQCTSLLSLVLQMYRLS